MGNKQSNDSHLKSKQIKSLIKTTHFDSKEVETLFQHFSRISGSLERDNLIDYQEFIKAIGTKDTSFARRLFAIFDNDGNGTISFEEVLRLLSHSIVY